MGAEKVKNAKELPQFRWAEVKQHSSGDDCWTVVNGKVYDITAFLPRHPGGDLIRQASGIDSSGMIEGSHPPAVVAAILPKYLVGELHPDEPQPFYTYDSEFWTVLKDRVQQYFVKNNLSRHDTPEYYFKAATMLVGFVLCWYMGFVQGSLLFAILAGLIAPCASIGIMHDGQHGAASKNPKINMLTGLVVDFFGASGYVWRHQHNIGHHQHTNTDNDPDAYSAAPLMRFHEHAEYHWYHRYQHFYVWPLYSLVMFRWYIADMECFLNRKYYNISFYPPSTGEATAFWLGKLVYFLYAVLVPVYCHGLYGLLYTCILVAITGWVFSFQFVVNHVTSETHWPTSKKLVEQERDWAKLQVMTSCDYAPGSPWANWVSSGLNYQIEHHLFPTICHTHYPAIGPIVKETCKEFGVFYPCLPSYMDALRSHYHHIKALGQPPAK